MVPKAAWESSCSQPPSLESGLKSTPRESMSGDAGSKECRQGTAGSGGMKAEEQPQAAAAGSCHRNTAQLSSMATAETSGPNEQQKHFGQDVFIKHKHGEDQKHLC